MMKPQFGTYTLLVANDCTKTPNKPVPKEATTTQLQEKYIQFTKCLRYLRCMKTFLLFTTVIRFNIFIQMMVIGAKHYRLLFLDCNAQI